MGMVSQKIVIVRRATRLQGLKRKFATVAQAEFLMDRAREQEAFRQTGEVARRPAQAERSAIADYRSEDQIYQQSLDRLQKDLHGILPIQLLDRDMLPTYIFGPADIVVTVGQDGLVANTAKYVHELPIIGVNPDPGRFDGVLLPFRAEQARSAVLKALEGRAKTRKVTMAHVALGDGQTLLAFNDFFVGARSHVSARYRIEFAGHSEPHSSSGVIVSTGAGSTGWLSSVFNMAAGLSGIEPDTTRRGLKPKPIKLSWEDPRLLFVVREPFVSKSSAAGIVSGTITTGQELLLESQMPSGGVIFSDGIETDFIEFNSGNIARIRAADHHARLVVSG